MSDEKWKFGTIVEHCREDGNLDIAAMVVLDNGMDGNGDERISLISLDGPIPGRDSFYAHGQVWKWTIRRSYWTVVSAP